MLSSGPSVSIDVREALSDNLWFVAEILGDKPDKPWKKLAKWLEEEDFAVFDYEDTEQAESIGHSIGMLHGLAMAFGTTSEDLLRNTGLIP